MKESPFTRTDFSFEESAIGLEDPLGFLIESDEHSALACMRGAGLCSRKSPARPTNARCRSDQNDYIRLVQK
jgi:hypothetical protein